MKSYCSIDYNDLLVKQPVLSLRKKGLTSKRESFSVDKKKKKKRERPWTRQILPRMLNHRAFSRTASGLFSLKSYRYFDTKFAKIGHPVMESHDLFLPEVTPKSEIFFCVYKTNAKLFFLFCLKSVIFLSFGLYISFIQT